MGSHQLAGYEQDWVNIDATGSAAELRARIIEVDARSSYASCDHCGEGGEMLPLAGEQGIGTQYIHFETARASSIPKPNTSPRTEIHRAE
jgi:hypothetical protein